MQPLYLHFGENCAVNDKFIAKKSFLVGDFSRSTSCWRADREIPIDDGEVGVNYYSYLPENTCTSQRHFTGKDFFIDSVSAKTVHCKSASHFFGKKANVLSWTIRLKI